MELSSTVSTRLCNSILSSCDSVSLWWKAVDSYGTDISSSFLFFWRNDLQLGQGGEWLPVRWLRRLHTFLSAMLSVFSKRSGCVSELARETEHQQYPRLLESFNFTSNSGVAPCKWALRCWSWLIQTFPQSAGLWYTAQLWAVVFFWSRPVSYQYWSRRPNRFVTQPADSAVACTVSWNDCDWTGPNGDDASFQGEYSFSKSVYKRYSD